MNANLIDADVRGATLAAESGLTAQLYSTASYQAQSDSHYLGQCYLAVPIFCGQNLHGCEPLSAKSRRRRFETSRLTHANLSATNRRDLTRQSHECFCGERTLTGATSRMPR